MASQTLQESPQVKTRRSEARLYRLYAMDPTCPAPVRTLAEHKRDIVEIMPPLLYSAPSLAPLLFTGELGP